MKLTVRAEGGTEDRALLMKELSSAPALGQDTVFPRCAALARLEHTGNVALRACIRYDSLSTLTR